MIADYGKHIKAILYGVIYVPGLKRCLFSVTAFANRGHNAIVKKNEIHLMFRKEERTLTLMLKNECLLSIMLLLINFIAKKRIDLELAHARFVRPSGLLLAASSTEAQNDLSFKMSHDVDCINCKISTIKATARIKHQSTPITKPRQVICMEIT